MWLISVLWQSFRFLSLVLLSIIYQDLPICSLGTSSSKTLQQDKGKVVMLTIDPFSQEWVCRKVAVKHSIKSKSKYGLPDGEYLYSSSTVSGWKKIFSMLLKHLWSQASVTRPPYVIYSTELQQWYIKPPYDLQYRITTMVPNLHIM